MRAVGSGQYGQHLVFDDEKETFMYTGDDRIKMRPSERA
jgi:hypothetical protein